LTDYRAQLGDQIADADPLRSGRVGVRPNSNGNLRTPDDATERLLSKYRENRLLCVMAADDLAGLQPNLKKFSMAPGAVLHAPGQPIEHVYFPVSGMVSLLAVMRTGEQIETATIGREGVLGASIGCGGTESVGQAMVQIEGIAWQLQTSKFLEMYQASANISHPYESISKSPIASSATVGRMSRATHGNAAPVPLVVAIARHYAIRYGAADSGCAFACPRRATHYRDVLCSCAPNDRSDSVPARPH
jgi:CRP-like cAMP-binding protein